MKNILQALAFMLIGAALYYFVAPQFEKSGRGEQYVLAPQVFLNDLESQTNANLDSFQKNVQDIALKLTQPKANYEFLAKELTSQSLKTRDGIAQVSRVRDINQGALDVLIKGPGVPVPPPPPPPCKGCGEWRIRFRDPIVVYSRNPIRASILDKNGKVIISSEPGSTSQKAIGSNFKITLNLPESAVGNATLQLEDESLKNVAKLGMSIR
jgi:hypothetical protein